MRLNNAVLFQPKCNHLLRAENCLRHYWNFNCRTTRGHTLHSVLLFSSCWRSPITLPRSSRPYSVINGRNRKPPVFFTRHILFQTQRCAPVFIRKKETVCTLAHISWSQPHYWDCLWVQHQQLSQRPLLFCKLSTSQTDPHSYYFCVKKRPQADWLWVGCLDCNLRGDPGDDFGRRTANQSHFGLHTGKPKCFSI